MMYRSPTAAWSSRRLATLSTFSLLVFLILSFHLISRNQSGSNSSWLDIYHSKSHSIRHNHALDGNIAHLKEVAEWDKPKGMKVVALVFYGRRRYVEILDCYLKVHISLLPARLPIADPDLCRETSSKMEGFWTR